MARDTGESLNLCLGVLEHWNEALESLEALGSDYRL